MDLHFQCQYKERKLTCFSGWSLWDVFGGTVRRKRVEGLSDSDDGGSREEVVSVTTQLWAAGAGEALEDSEVTLG